MQTQHVPSAGLHAKAYDAKENAIRNTIQPATSQGSTACRPASAPSFGSDSPYIEHTRRDSRGVTTTKRYLKGQLLGKGGFAKCYKITDVETKKDWACKVVQKSSLTKQRHKVKVGSCALCFCRWLTSHSDRFAPAERPSHSNPFVQSA
jgi:hypothetical protein